MIVATPFTGLATSKARAALAPSVSRKDAVFNLQRVLSLVHALQHGEYERLREAMQDRWHQPARAALVPHLARGCSRSTIPTCSAPACRVPVRRLRFWRGATLRELSGFCSRRAKPQDPR